MKNFFIHLRSFRNVYGLGLISIFCLVIISSCVTGGKPPYEIKNYILTYTSDPIGSADKINATMKFSRFSIASAYNSTSMIFRKGEYSVDAFNYSRWAVNPADMIADFLLRDIRASNLFHAVFSRYATEEGRFILSGNVEEFDLLMDQTDNRAVISIVLSLTDALQKETGKKVVWQKKYSIQEPLRENSPYGYSEAASRAMKVISQQIIGDIYEAVKGI